MADDIDLLAAADKAFVDEMLAIDAESVVSAKEASARMNQLTDKFVLKASEFIGNPLGVGDVNGQSTSNRSGSNGATSASPETVQNG